MIIRIMPYVPMKYQANNKSNFIFLGAKIESDRFFQSTEILTFVPFYSANVGLANVKKNRLSMYTIFIVYKI